MERAPKTLVVDASVAAKWVLEEREGEKALALRDAHLQGRVVLTAPDLLVYEFMNALNYNPKISSNEIVAKVRDLLDLELELVPPSGEYGSQIARIARKYSISIYDASYVALANLMVTRLVTANKKLREKLPASANVLLIEDLSRRWSLP